MSGLSDRAIGQLRTVANWPEFSSDRYVVTEEIGRGGMGTVYAATDSTLGRDVAIKISNTVAGGAFEEWLSAEARVLASLEHPGIVPIHDAGRLVDGRPFYVMKRVHGRTLADHLRGDLEEGERLRIFERICETVSFAHSHGILHRDLKPDNVMLGAFGEVMVLDWGVARAHAGADQSGVVVGTHGFMSPEQARGELATIDERTDVYGLGGVLLALLSGDAAPLGRATVPVDAVGFERIPKPLQSICARALAVNAADRYASAAALGADVSRYRAGQAVLAHRETLVEQTLRVAKAYRTPILLVVAYMVMRTIVALLTGR